MTGVVITGIQWGDEGKGKFVDMLADKADFVVRFQGGNNAGHTLVVDGKVYKLRLLPSGVVRDGVTSIIGNGVVFNPWGFFEEVQQIESQGRDINPNNLMIAENTTLLLPIHMELDALREEHAQENKIGTTKSGIGPAYEDKVGRRAIRLCDLAHEDYLKQRLSLLVAHHNVQRQALGAEKINEEKLFADIKAIGKKILPYVKPVWKILDQAKKESKNILFEGAQGTYLDIDHGTYPYVTSSNTVAGNASAGTGMGSGFAHKVLGIVKAYTTRVGEGPFVTELTNNIGEHLAEKGHEFGTVTNRPRRCGWFDSVMVAQSVALNGCTSVVLTKIDVLDEMEELKICTGYKLNGEVINYVPASIKDQENIIPIYETLPGWKSTTYGITTEEKLPIQARNYIKRIEELIGVKASLISTSPERNDTIIREKPFS